MKLDRKLINVYLVQNGECNLKINNSVLKAILLAVFVVVPQWSASAGCDNDIADAELQVASGMSIDQIRKLISSSIADSANVEHAAKVETGSTTN